MADWLCPHTPDICDYPETCATKLAAEVARLKQADSSKFLQITSGGWNQLIAVDQIARIFKNMSGAKDDTSIKLKDGTTVAVEESIKTIQCRIGCELRP